jgi:hypothetical protein
MNFTAAQIAVALGMKRQAVAYHLRDVAPSSVKIANGNAAAAWTLAQLPTPLCERLRAETARQHCRDVEALLAMPRIRWPPPLALDKISDLDIQAATKLRDALKPWMIRQHDAKLSPAELDLAGMEDYRRVHGHPITRANWRKLFERTVQRDNGFEEWSRLELYLPGRPKQKDAPADVVSAALADDFAELEQYLFKQVINPHDPSEAECIGLWWLTFKKYTSLVSAGESEKSASRRCRAFLFARAKFLSPTRNALRMAFERRLDHWQRDNPESLADGRKANGDRAEYPRADIRRLRHSAVLKNGGRIDAAWREEYPRLSEYTRQRHPVSRKCPRALYQLVNRIKVDALCARLQGKRTLRRLVGGVTRNAAGIPAMARWAADDWTSNVEVVFPNRDGTISLIQPQIITVMDFASRKWVGWSMSNDKAPTAELVCAAITDGFRRHGVPAKLFLENGFVFGKSLNVNGKEDVACGTVVSGLAKYGCAIHHFDKMSPTSKGELEKSFDLFQRQMERLAGYGGRTQMLDASEDFKREQRLIRAGKVDAKKFRFTFAEFTRVMLDLIEQYNSTPQHGHLHGLSPNEAFEAMKDLNNPPVRFTNELEWLLANEHYQVIVTAGGVVKADGGPLRHYGRKIEVRGGELPQHIGQRLWALINRSDASMVTFMSKDFQHTFTVETCQQPSADETQIATGGSVLATEKRKIGEHTRAVETELKDLTREFGNPRHDLLAKYRGETDALSGVADGTTRRVILNSRMQASAGQMQTQRADITAKRQQNTANKSKAARQGIPTVLADNDDQTRRALELLGDIHPARFETTKETK